VVHSLDVSGEAVKRGYVTEDGLNKRLNRLGGRIQGPTCEAAWSLSELLGFELWLRLFFGEGANAKEVDTERGSESKPHMILGGRR
jgi:hypothetical protein